MAAARKLGKISVENCVVMICDLQEKFAPSILHFDVIVKNACNITKSAQLLGLPVLATEQYPKVLILLSNSGAPLGNLQDGCTIYRGLFSGRVHHILEIIFRTGAPQN